VCVRPHCLCTRAVLPRQIFMSPAISYSAHEAYARPVKWDHPVFGRVRAQAVFEVFIRPTTYSIGHETVRATGPLDESGAYPNTALEWYTPATEHGAIILTALLIRFRG
jgi:hypothetical protein